MKIKWKPRVGEDKSRALSAAPFLVTGAASTTEYYEYDVKNWMIIAVEVFSNLRRHRMVCAMFGS